MSTSPEFIERAKKWCEDLQSLTDGEVVCKLADLLAENAALARQLAERGWRSVSESLPEYMRSCLVWCPERENIYCAYYHFYAGSNDPERKPIWCFFDNDGRITEVREEVTHWMPLPPAPDGKEEAWA